MVCGCRQQRPHPFADRAAVFQQLTHRLFPVIAARGLGGGGECVDTSGHHVRRLKWNATFFSNGSLVSASPVGNVTCDVWMAGRGSGGIFQQGLASSARRCMTPEKTLRKASSYSLK